MGLKKSQIWAILALKILRDDLGKSDVNGSKLRQLSITSMQNLVAIG